MNEPINVMIEQALPIVVTVEKVEVISPVEPPDEIPDLLTLYELSKL